MKEIKRVSAGVMFESDVLNFVDQLATAQQRNRSFIINSIIRYYSRMTQSPTPVEPPQPDLLQKPQPTAAIHSINF